MLADLELARAIVTLKHVRQRLGEDLHYFLVLLEFLLDRVDAVERGHVEEARRRVHVIYICV